jgi:F-type H+-transporting ATPase subunit b
MPDRKLLTATAAGLLATAAAFAAEGAEGGGAGAWNPFLDGDFGNFLWTLVTLVVVYLILKRFAWRPLLGALQKREEFIADALRKAAADRDRAEALLADYEAKLAAARDEVEAMLDEGRRDAAVLREREETRAKSEARQIVDRARREIDIATDTAVKQLFDRAASMATQAAGRILERELDPRDHERLVAEAIETLGSGRDAH